MRQLCAWAALTVTLCCYLRFVYFGNYMNPLIIGAAVIVIAILIFNSAMNTNPEAKACAQEILALLKQTPTAKAERIAEIMERHQRTRANAGAVSTLVKAGLAGTGILKNDRQDVMLEVRKAKMLLKN